MMFGKVQTPLALSSRVDFVNSKVLDDKIAQREFLFEIECLVQYMSTVYIERRKINEKITAVSREARKLTRSLLIITRSMIMVLRCVV